MQDISASSPLMGFQHVNPVTMPKNIISCVLGINTCFSRVFHVFNTVLMLSLRKMGWEQVSTRGRKTTAELVINARIKLSQGP